MKSIEMEKEANIFALLLLMPEELFAVDMKNPIDIFDDNWLKKIADKYQVPPTAVIVRIIHRSQYAKN